MKMDERFTITIFFGVVCLSVGIGYSTGFAAGWVAFGSGLIVLGFAEGVVAFANRRK